MPVVTTIPDPMSMMTMPEGGPVDFSTEGISSWVQQKIGAVEQSYFASTSASTRPVKNVLEIT